MIRWPCWPIRLRRLRHRRSFVAVEPRRHTAQVHNLVLSDTNDGRITRLLENKRTEITKAVGKGVRSAGTRPVVHGLGDAGLKPGREEPIARFPKMYRPSTRFPHP